MHRYFTELMGVFFLTLAFSLTSFTGNPIPAGLMLMAMIYVGAHISGAHYNPAISLGIFMRNRLNLNDFIMYVLFQTIGAFLSIIAFYYLTESLFASELSEEISLATSFTPELSEKIPLITSVAIESLLTFVLCITALTVMLLERYRNHVIGGFVIGLTLIALSSLLSGIFNPAIAIGALIWNMIKGGSFVGMNAFVIYIVGSFGGGAVAAVVYYLLNERMHTTDIYR